jgi:hypothetical protein
MDRKITNQTFAIIIMRGRPANTPEKFALCDLPYTRAQNRARKSTKTDCQGRGQYLVAQTSVLSSWVLREYDLLGPLKGMSGLIVGLDKGIDLIAKIGSEFFVNAPDRVTAFGQADLLPSPYPLLRKRPCVRLRVRRENALVGCSMVARRTRLGNPLNDLFAIVAPRLTAG